MLKKMKMIAMVALLAATTMAFMSCSKESKIEGKWKITKAPSELSDDKGETWSFKEGGSGSICFNKHDFDVDWAISKDNLTIEYKEKGVKLTGDFTIDELKSRTMSLSGKWTIKYTDDYKGDETESIKANYEFEKK